ncbi:MAG: response regulator transcription factor [Bacteroidales bacterium]|nr:response regulator transcription factor [Bacteroidales bacterium]MCM1416054.1 response regulator transcription factor [bacterium]MCM1424176.1 response regulator transcription factor [bacterium]
MEQKIGTRHRILVVEDDTVLAGGLCRALQNESAEAASCHTLREAAALLGQAAFDLVVLDVNLPDGNGFDFLQKIKAEYDMCVILLTANDMETDIVAGLELGADDYITKPFSLAVLRARVETQLRRVAQRKAAGDGWITDGAYRFHFAKMLFFHGEEQVELSKIEQRILRMLLENRNVTVTREQLFEFAWSVDAAFVDENTLSVAVKRLRDKLGAQDKIKTVYGIGYKWENT